jgi:two-component system phosphate regulon response regulator PhoB
MTERVLVVDDEEDLLDLIVHHLGSAGYDVVTATSGAKALADIGRESPALVLLDVGLPDISGTDVLRRLRREQPTRQLPVILVTARQEEVDRVVGFELGADDYVTKPFSPRELVLRVQAVLRRARDLGATVGERLVAGPLEIDVPRHLVSVHGESIPLTALEFRLLLDLARRRGRVQNRDDLLERVWRYPGGVETRTVDTHVKRLREKLGAAGEWIETVRGVGYRLRDEV